ncbi:hypothetical protein OH491_24275 [Termitidicoccus mucosus]|uniref:Uncharacterized protein n=1 Tax=Termitidicoccus mucosus TaxID=1184151 RepID=A0A178IQU5_9BACT|nr:hypothetical protein AW736_02170 [Opitutaceae bacterium TSB47]
MKPNTIDPQNQEVPQSPGQQPFRPAHKAVLETADLRQIYSLLRSHPERDAADKAIARIREASQADASKDARNRIAEYQDEADSQYARDGEIKIDEGAAISEGEDGAYVQAWVFVSKDRISAENDTTPLEET